MGKELVVLGATLLLSGCGGYFDQHPANVRPESEAVATVLAHQRPAVSALSGPVTAAPAPPAQVTQSELPTPAALAPKDVVASSSGVPSELRPATPVRMEPAQSVATVAVSPSPAAGTGRGPSATRLPAPAPLAPKRVVVPSSGTPPELPSVTRKKMEPANSVAAVAVLPGTPGGTGRVPSASIVTPVPQTAPVTQIEPSRVSAPQSEPALMTAPQPFPPVAAMQSQPVSEEPEATPPVPSRVYSPPLSQPAPVVVKHPVPETPPAPIVAPAPLAASSTFASDTHCEAVARQRADDAAASGLDRDTQEIVLRGAFADCVAWDRAHPASPP